MKKLIYVVIAVCIALPATAKEGFYAGADFMHDRMVNSDFGSLNSAVGLDILVGYDFGGFSLQTSLMGSKHEDRRAGYGDSNFSGISFDIRVPFTRPESRNQVYVIAGLGGYSLKGYDGSLAAETTYSGGGFDLGLGTEHYFDDHLAFDLAAVYRAITYEKRESQGTTTDLSPGLNGDTLSVRAGVNYHF